MAMAAPESSVGAPWRVGAAATAVDVSGAADFSETLAIVSVAAAVVDVRVAEVVVDGVAIVVACTEDVVDDEMVVGEAVVRAGVVATFGVGVGGGVPTGPKAPGFVIRCSEGFNCVGAGVDGAKTPGDGP